MLASYVRLRFAQDRQRWRQSQLAIAGDVFGYLLLLRLLAGALWLRESAPPSITRLVTDAVANGEALRLVLFAAVLLPHLEVRVFAPLPAEPFSRFMSRRAFLLRGVIYPACSATGVLLATIAVVALGWRGAGYWLAFYLVFLTAWRLPVSRLVFMGALALAQVLALGDTATALLVFAVVAGAGVVVARGQLAAAPRSARPPSDMARSGIVLRKEIAYWRRFTSDQVYLVQALILVPLVAHELLDGMPRVGGGVPLAAWVLCWLSIVPLSRVVFNLFGSDVHAMPLFRREPERTVAYQKRRLRGYQLLTLVIQCGALWWLRDLLDSPSAMATWLAGALAFDELLVSVALLYSIGFVSEKEERFRWGRQFTSRNIHLTFLAGLAVLVPVAFVAKVAGAPGLLVLAGVGRWASGAPLLSAARRLLHPRHLALGNAA
jgi:hypothetical protein